MVGGDVVAHLDGDLPSKVLGHGIVGGRCTDIGAAIYRDLRPLSFRQGWDDHAVVDLEPFWHPDPWKLHIQVSRVSDLALEGRRRRHCWACQVDVGA